MRSLRFAWSLHYRITRGHRWLVRDSVWVARATMRETEPTVHPSSVIEPGASLGAGAVIWHYCHVRSGAVIGELSQLGQGCHVGPGVTVGKRVKIQNGVQLFSGVTIEDEVFLGPACTFTNVKRPRAMVDRRGQFEPILVRRGASVGANATVLAGVVVGRYALVGAGAVVHRSVHDYETVGGVPIRHLGWTSRHGEPLHFDSEGTASCSLSGWRYKREGERVWCLHAADEEAEADDGQPGRPLEQRDGHA